MIKHHSPAFNLLTARICIHGLNSMITSIETSCFSPVYIQMMLIWLPHDISTVTHHEALDIHCGLGLSPTSHQVNSLHISWPVPYFSPSQQPAYSTIIVREGMCINKLKKQPC